MDEMHLTNLEDCYDLRDPNRAVQTITMYDSLDVCDVCDRAIHNDSRGKAQQSTGPWPQGITLLWGYFLRVLRRDRREWEGRYKISCSYCPTAKNKGVTCTIVVEPGGNLDAIDLLPPWAIAIQGLKQRVHERREAIAAATIAA